MNDFTRVHLKVRYDPETRGKREEVRRVLVVAPTYRMASEAVKLSLVPRQAIFVNHEDKARGYTDPLVYCVTYKNGFTESHQQRILGILEMARAEIKRVAF